MILMVVQFLLYLCLYVVSVDIGGVIVLVVLVVVVVVALVAPATDVVHDRELSSTHLVEECK